MCDETEDSGKRTCRLCAKEHEVTILLFGQQSADMLLQEKLSKYLLIELVENDNLPKNICIQCCTKLHSLCSFVEHVRQAQLSLYRLISKRNRKDVENVGNHCTVDVATNVDDVDINMATLKVKVEDKNPQNYHLLNEEPKPSSAARKTFVCEICKRGYVTDIALRSHIWTHQIRKMKLKDMSEKKDMDHETDFYRALLRCKLCSRRIQRTYDEHMVMHASRTKVFTCKVCGRAYRSWACLRAHSITHSDIKPHVCHLCPMRFKRKLELQVHINKHTGKRPYKCGYCERTFASASNCHTHRRRIHTGSGRGGGGARGEAAVRKPKQKDKPESEMEAEQVGLELQCELVNDRGLFKYLCQYCTHTFTTRENYICHMFQHTGKKMFRCSVCPEEFITKKGLTVHCHKLHPVTPPLPPPPLSDHIRAEGGDLISKNVLLNSEARQNARLEPSV